MNPVVSIIFGFFGALIRWIVMRIINLGKGTNTRSFIEMWLGRNKEIDADSLLDGVINNILGAIFLVALFLIMNAFF